MKKLMIAAAIVCAAAFAQAATVNWASGVVFGPSDANGTIKQEAAYRLLSNDNVTMWVFATTGTELDNYTTGDAYKWATGGATAPVTGLSATGTASNGQINNGNGIDTGTYKANDAVKAIVLFTYKDENGKDWYLENKASVTIDGVGSNGSSSNLARYIGGVKNNGNLASWTAVPEPTSGLLLLLGVAGLALRRRRA